MSDQVVLENDWLGIATATDEQWKTIVRMMSYFVNVDKAEVGLQERCEKVLSNLDLLKPCEGCVPSDYTDELESSIIRKFKIHYRLAVTLAAMAPGRDPSMIDIVVEPNYEDASTIVVVHTDRKHVLLIAYKKVWNLEYDSVKTMLLEVKEDAVFIAEVWKEV